MFSMQDVEGRANVCVLGKTVVDQLFGEENPVGQSLRVNNLPFKVVGVLRAKGTSSTGQDQDDTVLLPYTTAQRKIKGVHWLDDIMCSISSRQLVPKAQDEIVALLRLRHRLVSTADNDFNIRTPQETMRLREETTKTLALMISSVASVSLVVGGIGVMNISSSLSWSGRERSVCVWRRVLASAMSVASSWPRRSLSASSEASPGSPWVLRRPAHLARHSAGRCACRFRRSRLQPHAQPERASSLATIPRVAPRHSIPLMLFVPSERE
jgi:putative ABC transport system permease protein